MLKLAEHGLKHSTTSFNYRRQFRKRIIENEFTACQKRDRLHIVAEILELARRGAMKTQVMYGANLSFTQLSEYRGFMLRIGLLEKVKRRSGRVVYKVTSKGWDFLRRYSEALELIKGKGSQERTEGSMPVHSS